MEKCIRYHIFLIGAPDNPIHLRKKIQNLLVCQSVLIKDLQILKNKHVVSFVISFYIIKKKDIRFFLFLKAKRLSWCFLMQKPFNLSTVF